jgi:hypothetical protein
MDLLSEAAQQRRGYFNSSYLKKIFAGARKKSLLASDVDKLNLLFMIEYWHRVFIDSDRLTPPQTISPHPNWYPEERSEKTWTSN